MFELRPGTNEAFAERLRSAAARRQQEEEKATRAPRATNKAKAKARRDIEMRREARELEELLKQVWEQVA